VHPALEFHEPKGQLQGSEGELLELGQYKEEKYAEFIALTFVFHLR
jgi:hypothetical protein